MTGGGISSTPLIFFLDTELTKARYQEILSICQGSLDDFQQRFNDVDGLFLGKTQFVYTGDDVIFG